MSADRLALAGALPAVNDGDRFDVVVAGGGASGLMAAVAAARCGARVLVIEHAGCFGGAGTSAMVAQWLGFYNGETLAVGGLPREYAERVQQYGGSRGFETYVLAEASVTPLTLKRFPFNPEIAKLVADELVLESGAAALLHSRVVGVETSGDRIARLLLESGAGRMQVSAACVIDATGDAVVTRHAGAPVVGLETDAARMGMSLVFRLSNVDVAAFRAPPRLEKRAIVQEGIAADELFWDVASVSPVGASDAICLMSHVDGFDSLDAADLTRAELVGRGQVARIVAFLRRRMPGFARSELAGIASQIGIRESVRLAGDYLLTENDVVSSTRFDDTIALGCGPLDGHEDGGRLRLFMPTQPFEIPLRTMRCRAVQNLFVTGRAISATRAANGAIRHQATAMALGQAAGHAAALAVSTQGDVHVVPAGGLFSRDQVSA